MTTESVSKPSSRGFWDFDSIPVCLLFTCLTTIEQILAKRGDISGFADGRTGEIAGVMLYAGAQASYHLSQARQKSGHAPGDCVSMLPFAFVATSIASSQTLDATGLALASVPVLATAGVAISIGYIRNQVASLLGTDKNSPEMAGLFGEDFTSLHKSDLLRTLATEMAKANFARAGQDGWIVMREGNTTVEAMTNEEFVAYQDMLQRSGGTLVRIETEQNPGQAPEIVVRRTVGGELSNGPDDTAATLRFDAAGRKISETRVIDETEEFLKDLVRSLK